MAKAGIGDETIILTIQRGPTKLDTSPQALITLKKAGLSDQVLNAVLAASNQSSQSQPNKQSVDAQVSSSPTGTKAKLSEAAQAQSVSTQKNGPPVDAQDLFQRALDAIAPKDTILSIKSIRSKADVVQTSGKAYSFERELTKVFPDSATKLDTVAGRNEMEVVTHDFGYTILRETKVPMSWVDVVAVQQSVKSDPIYVAQHSQDFSIKFGCKGTQEGTDCYQLLITNIVSATAVLWSIDPQNWRVLSIRTQRPGPEEQTDFSDYRLVDGIYRPFRAVTTSSGLRTEVSIQQFEINPPIDASLFEKPNYPITTPVNVPISTIANIPAGPTGLSLRVLQSESVPYVQESREGISASCSIVGNANTSAYVNSVGSSAYGNATTNWNQRMSCNSYDTTMRWPHILNVMFVRASDGNSYIIGCDRAWRWSKCVPLRAGDSFNARFTGKGLEVEAFNSKGKVENPTYHILQSAVSR
jgi:hypothetical protein